jgi:hypothetical protein
MNSTKPPGKVIKTANGHLSYEVYAASSEMVTIAGRLLEKEFGLRPITDPAVGLDEVALNIRKAGVRLGLGWDHWCGFYVTAYDEAGDSYIHRIARFLNGEFQDPKYERCLTL